MSLIVEDGSGLSTAESYLSVADCGTYHTNRGNAAWTGTDPLKEIALRKATQYLDAVYGRSFQGARVTVTQALAFPRYDVELDGWVILSTTIPQRLKDATAELAVRALTEDLLADQDTPGSIESESVTVGPISTSTTYAGGRSQQTSYPFVDAILAELVGGGTLIRRG